MKFLLGLGFVIFFSTMASAKNYQGTIVKLNGDTVECVFILREARTTHVGERIVIYKKMEAEVNGRKKRYSAEDITGFTIKSNGKWFEFESVNTQSSEGTIFMCKEHDGESLEVFTCVQVDMILGETIYHHVIKKKKEDKQAHFYYDLDYVNGSLSTFFEDCPVLVEKIKSKELSSNQPIGYINIAEFYESECAH